MNKVILLCSLTALAFSSIALAHPGRTASDGCHYCRTNCDSWGGPEGERHCHGGYSKPIDVKEFKPDVKLSNKGAKETEHSDHEHTKSESKTG